MIYTNDVSTSDSEYSRFFGPLHKDKIAAYFLENAGAKLINNIEEDSEYNFNSVKNLLNEKLISQAKIDFDDYLDALRATVYNYIEKYGSSIKLKSLNFDDGGDLTSINAILNAKF